MEECGLQTGLCMDRKFLVLPLELLAQAQAAEGLAEEVGC